MEYEIEDGMLFIHDESIGGDTNEIGIPIERILKLQAENKILREALEFYADENNWEDKKCKVHFRMFDCGYTARKALNKIKGE